MEDHSSGKTYEEDPYVQLTPACFAIGIAQTLTPISPNGRVI